MSHTVIKVENLSKQYRLGEIGTGSIAHDVNRWWHKVRGKEDPYLKIGETNDRTQAGNSDYVWALKDINFEVQQGEVMGIIGRNGAGKSTLLKILSKTTAPTTGNIKIKGRIASLLEVGTGFHPELSGRDNIYLNGAILGMTKKEIQGKFDEIVDFAGVERYIDTPVKRYSSGMYVRLAFAVAAHLEPEILIVDEVLAVGDAEFQKKCLGKMKDVSVNEGRTVLFVSHNMAAIEQLCNRGIVLNFGKTGMIGSIKEITSYYLNSRKDESKISLIERKDRNGNGVFKFANAYFKDCNNKLKSIFYSNEEIHIYLEYVLSKDYPNNVIDVSIAILNSYEIQLTTMGTEITQQTFRNLPKNGVIVCKIPKTSLVSGRYYLTLFCKVNNEISDWIFNAASFDIEVTDYYNTGKNQDSEQSIFLMDYNFFSVNE